VVVGMLILNTSSREELRKPGCAPCAVIIIVNTGNTSKKNMCTKESEAEKEEEIEKERN
jgi:hypothetical protein